MEIGVTFDQQLMILLVLLTVSLLVILYVFLRLYLNVKTIDSSFAIVDKLSEISKKLHQYNKELSNVKKTLYQKEEKLIDKTLSIVNSNNDKIIKKINSEFNKNSIKINSLVDLKTSITQIEDEIRSIRGYAIDQQESLDRYKAGYDLKITRSYFDGIIDLVEHLEYAAEQDKENKVISNILERLEIYLERQGVEVSPIKEGDIYREKSTFCKAEPIETINEEQNGKIESVKKKGYVYFSPDHETEIIRHAEVIVYRLKSKGGGL